jgi:hypothetical protein
MQGRVGKGKRGHSSKGKGRGKGKGKPHLKNRAPIGTEATGFASTGRIADSRTMDLRVEIRRKRLKLFSWPLRKGRKLVKSWPLLLQVT